MTLPLNKRDFDLFLSHAHIDRDFVSSLYNWLTEKSGLHVWYDDRDLSGGSLLAIDLQNAIERCRGILLVASDEALSRGWVELEYNAAVDQRANIDGFRIIVLRLKNANVEGFLMRGITWIDVPNGRIDSKVAIAILNALYPGEKRPNPRTARDVYVSCSWRAGETTSANAVCRVLVNQGFRLIGDAKDQKGFGSGDRVERIIASCGAFVAVIPYRGGNADAAKAEYPYKYFLTEIDFAVKHGIPSVIIADPRVRDGDRLDQDWLSMETTARECSDSVKSRLDALWDEVRDPPIPHYIFCALDLDSDAAKLTGPVRQLTERVTGMCTMIGSEIHEEPLHAAIIKSIRNALLMLADITDDNVNVCIEAGMALVFGVNVELIARGNPRRPPFMLRTLQMLTYTDDLDRIGIVHRVIRPYRRRIINVEI